jgi:hypothetical protein
MVSPFMINATAPLLALFDLTPVRLGNKQVYNRIP